MIYILWSTSRDLHPVMYIHSITFSSTLQEIWEQSFHHDGYFLVLADHFHLQNVKKQISLEVKPTVWSSVSCESITLDCVSKTLSLLLSLSIFPNLMHSHFFIYYQCSIDVFFLKDLKITWLCSLNNLKHCFLINSVTKPISDKPLCSMP